MAHTRPEPRIPQDVIGAKIVAIRLLTKEEQDSMGWRDGLVLLLDNGNFLIPSQDPEGNGPGALFTKDSTIC